MIYDLIVLGSGPAGMAAAVAARGRNHSVLVVGNRRQDSPLAKAELVENYLGMPGRTGSGMIEEMYDHAVNMGVTFVEGRVVAMMAWEGYALTVGTEMYQGKVLVLSPGVVRQAKYKGEAELLGRGVSYCATCDGMLYRGKVVTVVGRSKDSVHEANYLQGIGCQVTFVAGKETEGLADGIVFVKGNRIAVLGESTVRALEVDGQEIPCAGAFILRDAVAPSDLLPGLAIENNVIAVDRQMHTNLEGVFAAGDCTGAPLQVAKAVGEGHIAGLSASDLIEKSAI